MLPPRIRTVGPGGRLQWMKIYVRPFGGRWAAMILSEDDQPPGRDELKGIGVFGDTPAEAEARAYEYLGIGEEACEGVGRNGEAT